MALPGDDLLKKFRDLRTRRKDFAELKRQVDNIEKGIQLNLLTNSSLRSLGAVFADDDPDILGEDFFGKPASRSAIKFASDHVEEQLESLATYSNQDFGKVRRFVDETQKGFMRLVLGNVVGAAARFELAALHQSQDISDQLMEFGPFTFERPDRGGRVSPEEIGLAVKEQIAHLFSPSMMMASMGDQGTDGQLSDLDKRVDLMLQEAGPLLPDDAEFSALPPSVQQELITANSLQSARGTSGMMGNMVGSLVGIGAMFSVRPDVAITRFPKLMALANRTLVPGVNLRGKANIATAGLAAVGGMIGYGTAPDDATQMERITRAATVMGGTSFLGTLLVGRPFGPAARLLQQVQQSKGFKDATAAQRFAFRLGVGATFHPRMTLGQMANVGAIGAGVSTLDHLTSGKSVKDSVYAGAHAAFDWMGYDFAFTRLGNLNRFVDIQTRFSARLHQNMEALDFLPDAVKKSKSMQDLLGTGAAGKAADVGSAGVAGVTGAGLLGAFGAGLNFISGEDPLQGAVAGGAAGAAIFGFGASIRRHKQRRSPVPPAIWQEANKRLTPEGIDALRAQWSARLESILPPETITKLYDGQIEQLTHSEAQQLASILVNDSWQHALMDEGVDVALQTVGRRVSGARIIPDLMPFEEQALLKQQSVQIRKLVEHENAGTPIWDPELLTLMVQNSALRGRLARLKRDKNIDLTSRGPVFQLGSETLSLDEAILRGMRLQERMLKAKDFALPAVAKAGLALPKAKPAAPPPAYATTTLKLIEVQRELDSLLRTPGLDSVQVSNFLSTKLGGTIRKGKGKTWTLKVPGIERLRGKAVRPLLERLREIIRDTPPMQVGALAPGIMIFNDPDTGEESTGIFPDSAGLAALAAIGMVVMKGRGFRARGFAKQTRRILREANNKFGKEAVVTVNVSGEVRVRLGTEGGVEVVRAGEPVIVISAHNHPPQKGSLGGINVRNILPSPKDVSAIQLAAPSGRRDSAIGAVLSPGNSLLTVFRMKPGLTGKVTFDPETQAAVIKSLEDMQLSSFQKMLAGLGINTKKGSLDSLYTIASEQLGADAVIRNLIDDVFDPAGIEVLVNVSDDLFDSLVARHLHGVSVRPQMDLATAVRVQTLKGSPALEIVDKVRDPKIKKRLTEIDRGQPTSKLPAAANKVAPAGAARVKKPLDSSITQQEVSGMTDDLKTAQDFAKKHELELTVESVDGTRKFVLRSRDGEEIASDTSVRRVRQKLGTAVHESDQVKAAALEGKILDPAQTDPVSEVAINQAFGVLGGVIGAPLGGIAEQVFTEEGNDQTAAGAMVGGLTGYLLASFAAFKGAKFRLAPGAARALQLVRPDIKLMTPAQAQKKLGVKGISTEEYHSFPTIAESGKDFQTQHVLTRLAADSALKNKSVKERSLAVRHMLAKFIPSVVSLDTLNQLEQGIKTAGVALKMDNSDIARLWRGYLNQIAIGPSVRKDSARLNLLKLNAGEPEGPISSIKVMDDMKTLLVNAEVISGPATPAAESVIDVMKEIRALRTQTITPEAAELKGVMDILDLEFAMATSGPQTKAQGIFLGQLRPSRSIWNTARTIRTTNQVDGDKIMSIYQGVLALVENNAREWSKAEAELKALFAGTTIQERKWVKLIQGGDNKKTASQWRAHFENKNDRIIEIADGQKQMQEKLAREIFGDQNFEAWKESDYFQRYYTRRTIRELQKTGIIGHEPVFMPENTGWPQIKFHRSAFPRRFEEPIGPVIEDALEAGLIQLYGGIRKKNIDQILRVANGTVLKELARRQPFVAQAIARWVADIHGVPRASTVKARVILENFGLAMEERFPDMGPWGRAVMDKYFDKFQPKRLSQMIRGWSMMSKIGYVVTSPLVNLTQTLVNTGANVGFHSLFMGTIYAGAGKAVATERLSATTGLVGGTALGAGVGALLGDEEGAVIGAAIGAGVGGGVGKRASVVRDMEMGTARQIAFTSPWPSPFVQGKVYRSLAEEGGVLSQAFRKELDRATKATADPLRTVLPHIGPKTVAGAAIGAGVGAAVFDDEGKGAVFGAVAGAAAQTRLLKIAGQHARNNALIMFNFAEATNRIVSAAATGVEHKGILKAQRKVAAGKPVKNMESILRVGETVESAALGAAIFGGAAASTAVEGERLEAAEDVAGFGALFGGVMGALSRPRKLRMIEEIEQFKTMRPFLQKLNTQLVQEGPPTDAESLRWLMAQHTQMTQFQFGSASRGTFLRTPLGESMFALQTYTLNQAEFLGALVTDFTRSMTKGPGNYDTRIFRHLMLLLGAGSVMTSLYGFTGDERGSEYWISRIGVGLLPFVVWNESAQSWNMTNIISQFGGPFVSDVTRVAGTYFKLVTDPVARADWTQNIDKVFTQIIPALRQVGRAPATIGAVLDNLGQQGTAELIRGQQANATALGSPLTTIRGRTPAGEGGPTTTGGGPGAQRRGSGLGDLGDLGGL